MTDSFFVHSPALIRAQHALAEGHFERALALLEAAPYTESNAVAGRTLKALALSLLKRPVPALLEYRFLTQTEPYNPAHWSNLGNCLCELGREPEALEPLQKALLLGATDSALHFGLARAYAVLGPMELARRHIETAIARSPADAEFYLFQLRILQALDRWFEAKTCIAFIQAQRLDEGQSVEFGYLLFRGQYFEQAILQFSKQVVDADLQLDAKIGLVLAYERINRLDLAETIASDLDERVTQHNPKLRANFLHMRAKMAARAKNYADAKNYYERLLAMPAIDATLQLGVQFDYAAVLDKCQDADAAMQVLHNAHAARRGAVSKNHPDLHDNTEAFAVLEQAIPPWNPSRHGQDRYADPVFVVGFPRSGTTLLEQLLDAHAGLVSFDEQAFLQHLVRRLGSQNEDIFETIAQLNPEQWQQQRAVYFSEVAEVTPNTIEGQRPVDKNPLNMVRLPLLQNFFPHSKIVLAIRHPCDVVLSCYMQHFRAPAFALTFETLESTAQMYDKIFSHWYRSAAHLQLPVLEWKYEDLVAQTEAQARTLFEFLELPWQQELLAFTERAKNKGAIKTPSYTQVIERVNARAVDRWHAYKAYFTPQTLAYLEPWIKRFAYSV